MTQTIADIREKTNLSKASGKGKLYLLVLISVVMSGASIFLVLINLMYTQKIIRKPPPTLVQMTSGETIEIGLESPNYRSPAVIKAFVQETLYYLMTMTSYGAGGGEISALDPSRKKAEPMKVKVPGSSKNITQTAWLASEALEAKFADGFRIKLAEMTPPDVFTGEEEVILKIDYITEPEAINDARERWTGYWELDVVADLKVYRLNAGEVRSIPFNKRVTLRPIDTGLPSYKVEQFGQLAIALNRSQRSGLQITDIKDIAVADTF